MRSLWLALKSASLYPAEHPAFRNSAAELKGKADELFQKALAVRLGFSSRSLLVDGEAWEKEKVYEELAHFFHVRLILSLEMKPEVSIEDWVSFIGLLAQSPRDLVRAGGIRFLLMSRKLESFQVEELDYSELLTAEGVELRDVWAYLLSEALREPEPQKVRRAAEVFPRLLGQLSLTNLLADSGQATDLGHFFSLLEEKDESGFEECSSALIKKILRETVLPPQENLARLSETVVRLKDQRLAALILEEMARAENFNGEALDVLLRLLGQQRWQSVARAFEEEALKNILKLSESSRFKERVEELLRRLPDASSFKEAFSTIVRQISITKRPTLDPSLLASSYRTMLLELLTQDSGPENVSLCLAAIEEEWENITADKDFAFIQLLFKTFERKAESLAADPLFRRIREELADYIERSLLSGEVRPELETILRQLPRSRLGLNYYLITIFEEGKVTPAILRTFFHLFADEIFYFNLNLDQKKSDRRFLRKLAASLAEVDAPLSLATLKHIFTLGDDSIKVKTLEAMENLSTFDEKFLYPLLRRADFPLKKGALRILRREPETRRKAIRLLLLRRSPLGLRNRALIEHLRLVEDLDLREAADEVGRLARRRLFWNRRLHGEAISLLRKWGLG